MTFVFLIIHGPIAKAFATAFVIILSAFASAMIIFCGDESSIPFVN